MIKNFKDQIIQSLVKTEIEIQKQFSGSHYVIQILGVEYTLYYVDYRLKKLLSSLSLGSILFEIVLKLRE